LNIKTFAILANAGLPKRADVNRFTQLSLIVYLSQCALRALTGRYA
jgi:hypothetical protein